MLQPMPTHLDLSDAAIRLLGALVAGTVLGLNRNEHGHAAGLRTSILLCLAACLAMLQDKLLHAMAWEAANVHLGSARAAARIIADLNRRSSKWLRTATQDMAAATISDWKEWKKS